MINRTFASRLTHSIKTKEFWLAILCGLAFGLIIHLTILAEFWPPESLRVKLLSVVAFLLFSAACFWIIQHFLPHRLGQLTRRQRYSLLAISAFAPVILMAATLDLQKFAKSTVYFLLPSHTLQIQVPAASVHGEEEVVMSGFETTAGGIISFDTLTIEGWERRGNQLLLTDPAHNRITWQGRTGASTTLIFKPRSEPADVHLAWDGTSLRYELTAATTQDIHVTTEFPVPVYAGWLPIAIAIHLAMALIILALYAGLLSWRGLEARVSNGKTNWLMHAIPMYIVWSIYLLAFWPGFMSNDSVDQWGQMTTGQLVNWHPVAHTLTIWLITRLWYSPAAVALLQIVVLGGVLGWGIATLREFGAPPWLAWLTTFLLAVSPANGALSITLWKDVLFSAAVVALTIILFKIVATQGGWLDQRASWLFMGIGLLFISLYRQNGLFVALLSLLLIAAPFRIYWRTFIKAACLFMIIFSFFSGPALRAFNIPSTDHERYQIVMANLLAGHMSAGTYFSPQDQAVLKPAFPGDAWPYNCSRNRYLITGIDRDYLTTHTRQIFDITLRATLRAPDVTLQHFACQGDFVYRIPQTRRNEMKYSGIAGNSFGLWTASLLPVLYRPLEEMISNLTGTEYRDKIWFVWRMPFWMYLCAFGCVLFCIRNRTWRPLLVLIPGLLTVLPFIILSNGQIFRYVYSMYLIGILFSGYFWLCAFPQPSTPGEAE
jgi:hypothetical protein